jgi:hypothetical protein
MMAGLAFEYPQYLLSDLDRFVVCLQHAMLAMKSHRLCQLIRTHRCVAAYCCCSNKAHEGAAIGLLYHKVLWIRRYHSYGFYTC